MDSYDDEIYAYLTQPVNYRSAKQIASQLGAVDEKLLTDFWLAVKAELRQRLPVSEWDIDLEKGNWFSIHWPVWKHMGLNCDSLHTVPDFGLHCDPKEYDRSIIDQILDETGIRQKENMLKRTDPWPCYRHLSEYDFRQQQTMERILPDRREETVKSMVALFTDFVEKHGAVLDRIDKEARVVSS